MQRQVHCSSCPAGELRSAHPAEEEVEEMRLRLHLALTAVLVLTAVLLALHMPEFGAHLLPCSNAATTILLVERQVTNMVTGIESNLHALDTLKEDLPSLRWRPSAKIAGHPLELHGKLALLDVLKTNPADQAFRSVGESESSVLRLV
jgi:hypothetical protein